MSIELVSRLANPDRVAAWLEAAVRPHLRADVSSYARGRLRAWLRTEPRLVAPHDTLPGVPVTDGIWRRLQELIAWDFDYCLATYSGDDAGIGITPHRDAGYADYEAVAVHLTGECRWSYWQSRQEFGRSPDTLGLNARRDAATHCLTLTGGEVLRFNCKNEHAATPSAKRWNLNFWRRKPV